MFHLMTFHRATALMASSNALDLHQERCVRRHLQLQGQFDPALVPHGLGNNRAVDAFLPSWTLTLII